MTRNEVHCHCESKNQNLKKNLFCCKPSSHACNPFLLELSACDCWILDWSCVQKVQLRAGPTSTDLDVFCVNMWRPHCDKSGAFGQEDCAIISCLLGRGRRANVQMMKRSSHWAQNLRKKWPSVRWMVQHQVLGGTALTQLGCRVCE